MTSLQPASAEAAPLGEPDAKAGHRVLVGLMAGEAMLGIRMDAVAAVGMQISALVDLVNGRLVEVGRPRLAAPQSEGGTAKRGRWAICWVDGTPLRTNRSLQDQGVLDGTRLWLRFVEDDEAQQDEFEKTMVIQPSARPVEKLQAATGETASRRTLGNGASALKKARLQVLSGAFAGRELELTKTLTTLGRPGVQVAAITRRSEGFFIVHVDSEPAESYPLVNGVPIGAQARKLVDNDVIQLAGVKMGFFEG